MSQDGHPGEPAGSTGETPPARHRVPERGRARSRQPRRPSLKGGTPAQHRELGAQGQQTVRRLLEAALAEFDERRFQAVRVDDIVRRAQTSHGTFYLYFSNKEDLFNALVQDALHDMAIVTDEFPVVTRNAAGQAALLSWVHSFCRTYVAHAPVLRILTQVEMANPAIYGDGLQLMFRLSEVMAEGMSAGAGPAGAAASPPNGQNADRGAGAHAELTAVACLLMLERVSYLMSAEVRLPRESMAERIAAIIYAAFAAA
jgi:AcrR family transcriptional regulator